MLIRTFIGLALLYGAILAGLWLWQEKLLFPGTALPPDHHYNLGADVHEINITRPDARLNALHLRLPAPRGVVFFLHGNGGNLQTWFVNTAFYREANFDLFMLDYRGYGKSSGRIRSEAELRADVRAAWDDMNQFYASRSPTQPPPRVRVLYGRSLGTGLAAGLAADVSPELTILVSPYRSVKEIARGAYPWVPSAVLRYPLDTEALLPRLTGPVLLIHGERDDLIPPSHSQALLPLAQQGQLNIIPGAGHNDLQEFDSYRAIVREALAQAAR